MDILYAYIAFLCFFAVCIGSYYFTKSSHKKFKSMNHYGVIWRWKWKKKTIYALAAYCPVCQSELWFDDENSKSATSLNEKNTFLVCEKCGGEQMGRVKGGDRAYTINIVKREILRRVSEKRVIDG